MAASSVTGQGKGSALGKAKGAEQTRLGAEKIIGPRIVYAGNHVLDGSGDLAIQLSLSGVSADYVVMVTHQDVTTAAAISGRVVLSGGVATVTVKGAASDAVSVVVMKAGLAS